MKQILSTKKIAMNFNCALVAIMGFGWVVSCSAKAAPNYDQHVKPLFREHCLKCHNADESEAELDLSSFAATMKGGSSGAVVKAGRPEGSQLYRAIAHLDGAEAMPPESPKLAEEKLAVVRDWIRGGLIEGQGGKSQLRDVARILAPLDDGQPSPMPTQLPVVPLIETTRPPVPQAMASSPGAPLFAVSGQEQILLFGRDVDDVDKPYTSLGRLPFPEGTIHVLRFSRSGKLLLAAGGRGAHSGKVVLFDVKTGDRVAEIGGEVDSILAADISADHRYVALGSPSKLVKIYDTKTGELLHRIKKHTDWITSLRFSPDGSMLASGDRSGGVYVWEVANGGIVFTLDEHKVRVTDLSFRGDGKLLASVADDGNLIMWDMKDGWPARNVAGHVQKDASRYSRHTGILGVAFGKSGVLVTAGRDRTTRLWTPEGELKVKLTIENGPPVSVEILNGDRRAVVGNFDGRLLIWDFEKSSPIQELSTGRP